MNTLDDIDMLDEGNNTKGRLGRRRKKGDDTQFTSKNLNAERRRREKLSSRLLALRALVPKITNMNKETIITDAIDYIQELQNEVDSLTNQLREMETPPEEQDKQIITVNDATEEMQKFGIKEDVEVDHIQENKLWVRLILAKTNGRISRLIEAMDAFGFELTNTSVTTSKGALLVTSCVQGVYGKLPSAPQTRELLLDIVNSI